MSCPNANAPIDISLANATGKCDLKCAYSFKYPNSSCQVTNRQEYLSISYESFTTAPVRYNAVDYNVQEIRIYTPSLHSYDGKKTDGEIIIIHISNKGTTPLLVCIPFTSNNSKTTASDILTQIVNNTALSAPINGEAANIDINNFTLDAFVPKKPFYTYTAIQPYQPCVGNVNIITFMPREAKCYITSDTLLKLSSIIIPNTYTIKTGPALFFNDKGPNLSDIGDDIYIDCQPINKSNEEINLTTSTTNTSSTTTIDWDAIKNNPIFQIIMGSLLFIFIIIMFSVLLKMLGGNPSKINSSTKNT